jgi:hypothetical protein
MLPFTVAPLRFTGEVRVALVLTCRVYAVAA